jgi:hypothetical protein
MLWAKRKTHKYLFKANDDVLSFCTCENEPALASGQLDCPWCGCGWMISCSNCGKAFVFGEVRETDIPYAELGRREIAARGLKDVSLAQAAEWAEAITEALEPFEVGDRVVYLDGWYWKVDSTDVEFEGFYARHSLDRLPHAEALRRPAALKEALGDPQYWLSRELPDRE